MKILEPTTWQEYELLDTGDYNRLERFGSQILIRPEPQALWSPRLSQKEWEQKAHAKFVQQGSSSGKWVHLKNKVAENWPLQYQLQDKTLTFKLALTRFKHVGIFPEQAAHWEFIYDCSKKLSDAGEKPQVMNLFAYTGGSSLAARAGGAMVTHCDSVKQVVTWANTNMTQSGMTDIRWIVEDAFSFVKREVRRGNRYQGILLDPPSYGHGAKGETWKLEEQLLDLLDNVKTLLDPEKGFLVLNLYSLGFSSFILKNVLDSLFGQAIAKHLEVGELVLRDQGERCLPTGVFGRFFLGKKA